MKQIQTCVKESEMKIYNILEHLEVEYEIYEHEPINIANDLDIIKSHIKGHHCKNLFLKNSNEEKYFIVIIKDSKKVNLKSLRNQMGSKRLSFGSEIELYNSLKVRPGSVNPFSVVNDMYKNVDIWIDEELLDGQTLNFHPGINVRTVSLSLEGLTKFLDYVGYNFESVNVV